MTKKLAPFVALALAFTACASAKLKQKDAEIERLQTEAGKLLGQVKDKENRVSALEGEKAELDGKFSDASEKLKAAQVQIDSLAKSNQDLTKATQASQSELAGKLKEVIAEKDDLGRRLNESQKDKIAAERARKSLKLQMDKLAHKIEDLQTERDDIGKQLTELREAQQKQADEKSRRQAKVHEEMGELADAVLKELQAEQAKINQNSDTIEITLQEPLLFEPQQAKLTESGIALLERVGKALHALAGRGIRVEGHSDNSPIKWELFGRFTSHWDLSAARATAVARYLHEHAGLDPRRLTAAGFGEFKPAKANDTPEGRAANRRVVIVVEPPAS